MDKKLHTLSDDELIEQILINKNTELFGVLYSRHVLLVYNRCLSFIRNPQEAEDLTHDIFLKAFLKLGSYRSKSKFSTWLYSMTIHFCIDYSRKTRIQTSDIDNTVVIEDTNIEDSEDSLIKIKTEQLKALLEMIHPEEKMLLLLKYQDELSIDDISQLMNIGESATKMRLSRARQKVVHLHEKQFQEQFAL